jgi:cytidylate kinase
VKSAAEKLIIAIDGGAGTGTSTAAESVAQALGIPHLNTGSMYRAIAWEARRQGIDWSDEPRIESMAQKATLDLKAGKAHRINGREVGDGLYTDGTGRGASVVSGYKGVREYMVKRQRELAQAEGAVMEGRDIGTNVFPDTPYKFYFVCDAEERVRRLKAGGRHDETIETLLARDRDDEAHEHGTFARHDDALEIDTTHLDQAGVIEVILNRVRAAG